MSYTKFSVSMCVYIKDNPQWFRQSLESILDQTRIPDEVVLVVDGPVTIELENIINEYEKNPIFKCIRLKENLGHGNARKIGIENCTNELIGIMDADDIAEKNRWELQVDYMEKNPHISIVGGQIEEFIDNIENIIGKRIVPCEDFAIRKYMQKRCPFNQVTVMFRKKDILEVGNYKNWFCNEDYYLWIRLALGGKKFGNLSETLVYVRVGFDMYQRRGGKKYFESERNLQKYMLDNKIISLPRYFINVIERWLLQVLMPNWMRGIVFRIFARK